MPFIYKTLSIACLTLSVTAFAQFPASQPSSSENIFQFYDQALDSLKSQPNFQELKGWKYLARHIEYHRKRLNSDGSPGDFSAFNKLLTNRSNIAKARNQSGWTPAGPFYPATFENLMGRINCIEFHPTDTNTFFIGVAQGGIWKTVDGGVNWTPLDNGLPILRVSDIEIDPSNPQVIYASLGDIAYAAVGLDLDGRKRHTHYGLGVYKSTDGGLSWSPTGLSFTQQLRDMSLTRRVFVHPANSNKLLAAGFHGVWTSSDAGANWTQITDTLVWDIEMNPNKPNELYASLAYLPNLNRGGAGIMKSTDFGQTWTQINSGIPSYQALRVELAYAPSHDSTVYAVACNNSSGLLGVFKTNDAGTSWTMSYDSLNLLHWYEGTGTGGQGFYDLTIAVDKDNKDEVYVGGVNLWKSSDGANSFNPVTYWGDLYTFESIHADLHQLKQNPLNGRFYLCNDGGLVASDNLISQTWAAYNSGQSWPTQWVDLSGGMNITSFYRLGLTQTSDVKFIAGAQDNSTIMSTQNGFRFVSGGDGMECTFYPPDSSYYVSSSQYGNIISNYPGIGSPSAFNGAWTTPFMFNTDGNKFYAGYEDLYVMDVGLNNWFPLTNFPTLAPISHFSISKNEGVMILAKRPNFQLGQLSEFWRSTDGGSSWQQNTGLPNGLFATYTAISQSDSSVAYYSFGGFEAGKKVYQTLDAGQTWNNISKDLPNVPVNAIVHRTGSKFNQVFIATDIGVFYTDDTSSVWYEFNQDLPRVIASDLEINYATENIMVATFGRGVWMASLPSSPMTGIDETALSSLEVLVSPNPSVSEAVLQLNSSTLQLDQIQVIDQFGRIVHEFPGFVLAGSKRLTLPNNLPAGLYFVKVQQGNAFKSVKWLKQ